MKKISDDIRKGKRKGATGKQIKRIIHIGIGGSYLGPYAASYALKQPEGPEVFYVSNIDSADFKEATQGWDPEETLFIIASKTFTTDETMTNAGSVKSTLLKAMGLDEKSKNKQEKEKIQDVVAKHFIAVSTAEKNVADFGIDTKKNMIRFEDWVGGRFSLWSPIGLATMIDIGSDAFAELLQGANGMDTHFKTAKPDKNLPMLLGTAGYEQTQTLGTRAFIATDNKLEHITAHLQQLWMESNGKHIKMNGFPVAKVAKGVRTCPIIVGDTGEKGKQLVKTLKTKNTNAQIVFIRKESEVNKAKNFGIDVNASNVTEIIIPDGPITPRTIGRLIALFEHQVFIEGTLADINSFDQWGVELGKALAKKHDAILEENAKANDQDPSSKQALRMKLAIGLPFTRFQKTLTEYKLIGLIKPINDPTPYLDEKKIAPTKTRTKRSNEEIALLKQLVLKATKNPKFEEKNLTQALGRFLRVYVEKNLIPTKSNNYWVTKLVKPFEEKRKHVAQRSKTRFKKAITQKKPSVPKSPQPLDKPQDNLLLLTYQRMKNENKSNIEIQNALLIVHMGPRGLAQIIEATLPTLHLSPNIFKKTSAALKALFKINATLLNPIRTAIAISPKDKTGLITDPRLAVGILHAA